MANNHSEIEKRLWASADELRANSKLKSSEYSVPVLGLIFLRYADFKFAIAEKELAGKGSGRRAIGKEDYQAKGVMYLPPQARFSKLLALPEGENIGKAINEAMKAVEAENEELKGVLPKSYNKIENSTLISLLKTFSQIAMDAEGDTFGKIYEYFLGNFARAEGQKGGEFFTPTTMVKLIVEIIEPYHGRIFDPASGSGGMYVQSADFIKAHKSNPSVEISVYGQERVDETRHLCLINSPSMLSPATSDIHATEESSLIDLSQIDFDALKAHFEKGRKHIEAEKLKGAVSKRLTQMVQLNKTRTDLLEKFKKLIEEYNKGLDVEGFFEKLVTFAKELNEEDQRGVAEQLSEEELAIFDILTKPTPDLPPKEKKEVKKIARHLLQTLKQAKLVLDWRKKLRTRADVFATVKTLLDDLPRIYTPDLYEEKCDLVYRHVFDAYQGEGQSLYEMT